MGITYISLHTYHRPYAGIATCLASINTSSRLMTLKKMPESATSLSTPKFRQSEDQLWISDCFSQRSLRSGILGNPLNKTGSTSPNPHSHTSKWSTPSICCHHTTGTKLIPQL